MPKPFSYLTPSTDHQLAAWEQIQYRLSHPTEPRIRPTITLSRQFGCEGFPLAERLKALFEAATSESWHIYDKSLVEKVAQDEDISLRLLKNLGDMTHALESLGLYPSTHVTHDVAFEKVAKAIVPIAVMGNAIIVGRGSAILCKELSNCFHFRMEAGFDWRVARTMKGLAMAKGEAEEMVKINTRLREKFIDKCLGENSAELKHYNAVFNNERYSLREMAAAILAYVKSGWTEKGYFKR